MASFSFDIVSEIDKAEMNNVFMQAEKEIQGRYDFKGTSAAIDWLFAEESRHGFGRGSAGLAKNRTVCENSTVEK